MLLTCLPLFDAARAWQFLFQDEASQAMFSLVNFHHDVMFYLVVVFIFVLDALFEILIECAHRKPSVVLPLSVSLQLFGEVLFERNLFSLLFRRGNRDIKKKMFLFKRASLYTAPGSISSSFCSSPALCAHCVESVSFGPADHRVLFLPSGLRFTHNTALEVIWTVIPMCILLFIAGPSMSLLYSADELVDPAVTIKIIGHQWYWTYEINDGYGMPTLRDHIYPIVRLFDAYMVAVDDLQLGELRLLETTECLFVPIDICVRFLITSADVLHSWAVPSLGIKVDACPGRLNHITTRIFRPGVYYGQCSEICGINHAFMPIKVEGVDLFAYECSLRCH